MRRIQITPARTLALSQIRLLPARHTYLARADNVNTDNRVPTT